MTRVAIIGAGISGLVSIKWCLEEGLDPVCFERNDYIGGLWHYHENRRHDSPACVWRDMKVNLSRWHHMFSDFPDFEKFASVHPTHGEYLAYQHRYSQRYNLQPYIRSKHNVLNVEARKKGWTVAYEHDGKKVQEHFDLVLVASGRYVKPIHPSIPGLETFSGVYKHSNQFTHADTDDIAGKLVLVIGNSLSGGELAAIMADTAKEVWLSIGKGCTVLKRLMYEPDNTVPVETEILKREFAYSADPSSEMVRILLRNAEECLPNQAAYGLGPPKGRHPLMGGLTISRKLGQLVPERKVTVRKHAVRISGAEVEFDDGTKKEFDTIYAATGFDVDFPFLSDDLIGKEVGKLDLFHFTWPLSPAVIDRDRRDIAFVGMLKGLLPVNTMAELQARWAVMVFKGLAKLPSNQEMLEHCKQRREKLLSLLGKDNGSQTDPAVCLMDFLAEQIGALPVWWKYVLTDPYLAYILKYGGTFSCGYRLVGPHKWPKARATLIQCHEELVSLRPGRNWPKLLARVYQVGMTGLMAAVVGYMAATYKNWA